MGIVGLGNFLGGVAQGYQEMSKIQLQRDKLMLESQSLDLQQQHIAQSADQFASNRSFAEKELAQRLGLAERGFASDEAGRAFSASENRSERAFRTNLAQQDQMFQRDISMQNYNRDLVASRRTTPRDALLLATLQDLAGKLPEDQKQALLKSVQPMLGGSNSTSGGTVMAGINNPYASFYRGGILSNLGQ